MIEASRKDILLKVQITTIFLIFIFIWINFAFFSQQAVHVNSRVAFMFVLALASVNLASANPICTECGNNRTSETASKTVSVEKSFVFHVLNYSQRPSIVVLCS